MNPFIIGGLSALQMREAQNQAERDRMLQAQTALYSPWTHMTPQAVNQPNPWSDASLALGSALGQQRANEMDDVNKALIQAKIDNLNAQTNAGQPAIYQDNTQKHGAYSPSSSLWSMGVA